MGNIKYGTIEYFTLEGLRDKLRGHQYDKLDLLFLDKLKMEIDIKLKAIQNEYTERLQDPKVLSEYIKHRNEHSIMDKNTGRIIKYV